MDELKELQKTYEYLTSTTSKIQRSEELLNEVKESQKTYEYLTSTANKIQRSEELLDEVKELQKLDDQKIKEAWKNINEV